MVFVNLKKEKRKTVSCLSVWRGGIRRVQLVGRSWLDFQKSGCSSLSFFSVLTGNSVTPARLGVVAVELPLPARGSQTIGANCDQALWFCPFGFNRSCPLTQSCI